MQGLSEIMTDSLYLYVAWIPYQVREDCLFNLKIVQEYNAIKKGVLTVKHTLSC